MILYNIVERKRKLKNRHDALKSDANKIIEVGNRRQNKIPKYEDNEYII